MVNSAGVTSLSYPMFPCEDGITTVQHSMVCDFRQDCPDNSDESFCENPSRTGFLCSNVCMGGHVSMIVAADHVLYGHYFHSENMWTSSGTCKVAGFLSILSSEVFVILIWFIIVDNDIVICYLETSRTSGKWFTVAACTVSWCVGSLLSLVPSLPRLSSWGPPGDFKARLGCAGWLRWTTSSLAMASNGLQSSSFSTSCSV
ncbi:hypothetical protein ACOMHN_007542 [Nucella lapillus]